MLVGVDTISFLYDWDCPGDIVLSIDVRVMVRNKSHAVLDCDCTPMAIPNLVVVVGILYHHHDKEERVAAVSFYNPAYGVPDCDDPQERCATL